MAWRKDSRMGRDSRPRPGPPAPDISTRRSRPSLNAVATDDDMLFVAAAPIDEEEGEVDRGVVAILVAF